MKQRTIQRLLLTLLLVIIGGTALVLTAFSLGGYPLEVVPEPWLLFSLLGALVGLLLVPHFTS